MTTKTRETEIVADPEVPLVRITRDFDAPPEKVFRAHTDPELVVRWLGPRSLEMHIDHYDCRTGGRPPCPPPRGPDEGAVRARFAQGPPQRRVVQTFTSAGEP